MAILTILVIRAPRKAAQFHPRPAVQPYAEHTARRMRALVIHNYRAIVGQRQCGRVAVPRRWAKLSRCYQRSRYHEKDERINAFLHWFATQREREPPAVFARLHNFIIAIICIFRAAYPPPKAGRVNAGLACTTIASQSQREYDSSPQFLCPPPATAGERAIPWLL